MPYLILQIIKDKVQNPNKPEVKAFCLKLLDFIQYNTNDFLSNDDCSFCWLDLAQPRLVQAHWALAHSHLPISANLGQKKFLLQYFNMDLIEDNFHQDKMIQEIFKADNEEEYILFQRTTPTLTKFSSLLQIYLTTNHQDKMTFLTDLFQAPPITHTDSILFPYDPFPPAKPQPQGLNPDRAYSVNLTRWT